MLRLRHAYVLRYAAIAAIRYAARHAIRDAAAAYAMFFRRLIALMPLSCRCCLRAAGAMLIFSRIRYCHTLFFMPHAADYFSMLAIDIRC